LGTEIRNLKFQNGVFHQSAVHGDVTTLFADVTKKKARKYWEVIPLCLVNLKLISVKIIILMPEFLLFVPTNNTNWT